MHREKTGKQRIMQKIQGITAVLFILAGIMLGNAGERYGRAKEDEAKALAALAAEQEALENKEVPDADLPKKTDKPKKNISAQKKEEAEKEVPKPYEPAPNKLNLAFFYPEDAESEEIIDSYAGQVFQELMIMDLDWLSNLYELADISPSTMASRLGKGQKSVMGGYNPRDKAHKAGVPSSWVIHDWKKVHVNFIDGDGRTIDGFSNVKDILSMASVYTYYTDMMDVDTFAEYSRQLWKDSHSYSLSMGDFYYCSGCLNKTEEELVREAEADELAGNMAIAVSEQVNGAESTEDEQTQESLSAVWESGQIQESLPDAWESGQTQESLTDAWESGQIQESLPDVWEDGQIQESLTDAWESGQTQESLQDAWENGQTQESEQIQNSGMLPAHADSYIQDTESYTEIQVHASGSAVEIASSYKASSSNSAEATEEDMENTRKNTTQYDCPGHVDLYIRVKILGLNEKKGLYSIDKASVKAKDKKWEGWTKENMASVNKISNEDWFDDYGLRISSFSLSTPLTNQEIDAYMNQLPADTSVTRRNIIHFALSSVGRVPYYWGGKASAAGYEGNNFGALVPADDKGRILRGLDCSGWIGWVYWSATGKRLAGESTSSLCLCGKRISRSELKPGDIIVRTGTGAHVVMFLSWNANGQMNVIHESSASANNVSISTMDAPWPYYRKLVD